MEAWLVGLIAGIPQPFRAAAAIVINAVIRVFQWVDGLARRTKGGWNPITAAAQWLTTGIGKLGGEIYTTIKWMLLVKIPAWVTHGINVAVAWAADRITYAVNLARSLADGVLRWASDRIRAALDLLDGLRRWVSDLLAEIRTKINQTIKRVFEDWATPARLAEWLVGAMWGALWRYAWSQADRLAATLWAARRTLALRTVSEIEKIVGRIL